MLLGAVVGAGLALIFAPKAGSETRRAIGRAARRLKDGSTARMDRVIGSIREGAGDLGAAIDAGKEAYHANEPAAPVGADGV